MAHATVSVTALETRIFEAFVSFGADESQLSREATLESLDVDSLDLVELAQILDEEFGIKVESKDFESVVTVGDALDRVTQRV
jgi:acyl carrier protein